MARGSDANGVEDNGAMERGELFGDCGHLFGVREKADLDGRNRIGALEKFDLLGESVWRGRMGAEDFERGFDDEGGAGRKGEYAKVLKGEAIGNETRSAGGIESSDGEGNAILRHGNGLVTWQIRGQG